MNEFIDYADGKMEYFDPETGKYGVSAASSLHNVVEIAGLK